MPSVKDTPRESEQTKLALALSGQDNEWMDSAAKLHPLESHGRDAPGTSTKT